MVVAKCKMQRAKLAEVNAEKTKKSLRLEMNTVSESTIFLKTHNKPD
jgi:hypothetical protein